MINGGGYIKQALNMCGLGLLVCYSNKLSPITKRGYIIQGIWRISNHYYGFLLRIKMSFQSCQVKCKGDSMYFWCINLKLRTCHEEFLSITSSTSSFAWVSNFSRSIWDYRSIFVFQYLYICEKNYIETNGATYIKVHTHGAISCCILCIKHKKGD